MGRTQDCNVKNRTRFYGGSVEAGYFLSKIFSSAMLEAPQERYPRAAHEILKHGIEPESSIEVEASAKFGYLKDIIDLFC